MTTNATQIRRLRLAPGVARQVRISLPHMSSVAKLQVVLGVAAVGATAYQITRSIQAAGVLEARPEIVLQRAFEQESAGLAVIPQPQRDWFFAHRAAIIAAHGGQYVAVSGDQVAASDVNLSRLIKRFYSERGVVDVYFGYAGEQEPAVGLPTYLA
jgi:hypothetical protein